MTVREFQSLKIGDRVRLRAGHPWSGHSGRVIAFEPLSHLGGVVRPRLRLDNCDECYLVEARHAAREIREVRR